MNKLLHLAKTNLVMLFNAASLVATTAITSILGFAYWWVAARFFSQDAIGLASSMISVMSFLGTIAMLGLGTLLTGELPRQTGKEWSLINGALIIVGGAGIVAGAIFALLAPLISSELDSLRENVLNVTFFSLGVSLTALTLVLDQALIGILRGGLQFWRNTLFSVIKLAALAVAAFLHPQNPGLAIYVTWLIGNLFSLAMLLFAQKTPAMTQQESDGRRRISGPLHMLEKSLKLPCPECGELSPNGAGYCLECGYPFSPTLELASVRPQLLFDYGMIGMAEMPAPKGPKTGKENVCPECEKVSPGRARFCSSCGYPLTPTLVLPSVKTPVVRPPFATPLPSPAVSDKRAPLTPLPPSEKGSPTGKLSTRFEKARVALAEESKLFAASADPGEPGTIGETPRPDEETSDLTLEPLPATPLPGSKPAKTGGLWPQWDLLRKLGKAAIQHHVLNLVLLAPTQILPLLVTALLSTRATAQFYVAFMLANFIFTISYALSTVLYAVGVTQPSLLAQKTRFTLGLSFVTSVGANVVVQVGAELLLSVFGHTYADQASWCLRILCLAVFPIIVKSHYLAICRVQERIAEIILPVAIGSVLELVGGAIGTRIAGLEGTSAGWLVVLTIEAIYMSYTVYKAAYPAKAISGPKTAKA